MAKRAGRRAARAHHPSGHHSPYNRHKNQFHPRAFIPAGFFIGLGEGLLANQLLAGIIIGLSVGFLASAFLSYLEKRK